MLSLADSYDYTARLTRREAKNFFHTFRLLRPERRQSIFAVYAFSRRADDAVDSGEAGLPTGEVRQELEVLRSFLGDSPPDDPLVPAIQHTIQRYRIPREPFDELLAGMAMDLDRNRYETFDELYEYCYRAASVIGLICVEIFGYEGDVPREPAIKLGIAMQLTNILRDVAEDRELDRIYLPAEDLRRFGYTERELLAGVVNDSFRRLMEFQVARARRFFTESSPLFPAVLPESRYCPVLLMRFYSRLLDRIERSRYDVFNRRPSLPTYEKLLLAGPTWLKETVRRLLRPRAKSEIRNPKSETNPKSEIQNQKPIQNQKS